MQKQWEVFYLIIYFIYKIRQTIKIHNRFYGLKISKSYICSV
jgi:hypothetical protein